MTLVVSHLPQRQTVRYDLVGWDAWDYYGVQGSKAERCWNGDLNGVDDWQSDPKLFVVEITKKRIWLESEWFFALLQYAYTM